MSKYQSYSREQIDELLSNFLIDSWSYSKVNAFSRNEKAFEKEYIYLEKPLNSATSIAGTAYHSALEYFFNKYPAPVSLVDMNLQSYSEIDEVAANEWKLQKTTPTIEQCQKKATDTATFLLTNFYSEKSVYTEEITNILGVELRLAEWITVNGVDLPLPCHAVIDLVVETKDGKVVIIDHKSVSKFSEENEIFFIRGKQAITYVKCYEQNTGLKVDEVWFVENKTSANKDKSPQLKKFKIALDDNTRMLYETMLYEPLKRMIEAVSNPDYIYTINDTDNLVDRAELYDFWARTIIADIDDFDISEDKKNLLKKREKKVKDSSLQMINPKVISAFQEKAATFISYDLTHSNMSKTEKIEHVLRTFGIAVKVAHEISGYSSDTFLLEVSAGTKISNIFKFKLDIANCLNVSSVRIGQDLLQYEGKAYLYIEAPKKRTKDLLFDASLVEGSKIPVGMDNFGRKVIWDLDNHSTPHMLICGATGSGKSVSILSTIEYAMCAGIEDVYIFDPKYEFCKYSSPKVKVFNEIEDIEKQMAELVKDMQSRAKLGTHKKTLIVFDEFADAVSASRSGAALDIKEEVQVGFYAPKKDMPPQPKYAIRTVGRNKSLEENLKILLQKGRSLGFRIMAATQRASVNVITGDAKVNFPVQVCFRVPKEIDSKVVIDEAGAESLAGRGDGLIKSPEYSEVVRFQGFYKPC